MSYSLPVDPAKLSRKALSIAKVRLGNRLKKLEECEVGDFVPCDPRRQPGDFALHGKRFEIAQTWVSNGFGTVPIVERIA